MLTKNIFNQIIGISIISICILLFTNYYDKSKYTDTEQYDKMYKIIFKASELDKDIYKRKKDRTQCS